MKIKICGITMPSPNENILKFNQDMKSDKITYITYADLESLIKKIDGYENDPKNLQQQKLVNMIFADVQ